MAETSWISEQKRLLELQNDCEPEPMESINCQFIFIDSNNFIQKISKEKAKVEYDVENDQYIVSKKRAYKNKDNRGTFYFNNTQADHVNEVKNKY